MKNHRLSIFLIATLPMIAVGKQLSTTDAFDRAMGDVQIAKIQGKEKISKSLFDVDKPAFTATVGGINTYYIINRTDGNGFAVVAADDCAAPLLGYSDDGAFDSANIPEALKWWLSQYQAEIKYAIDNDVATFKAPRQTHDPVPALIATAWDQETPYNDQCPEYQGRHAYTGCVATAMAQIMKYHKWPARGKGSNSYQSLFGTESLDFSKITFDWANMLNYYTATSSEKSKRAVAQLMYACGVSVNMSFNLDESSALSVDIPGALIDYFDYDKGIRYLRRELYRINEWEDIIYSELREGRPVLYDGQSGSGEGHQFICDGYNEGFFHMNWGWGGRSNGYYRLSALEPQNVGVGAGSGEYNFGNNIIIGIQPNKNGAEADPLVFVDGDFSAYQDYALPGAKLAYFTAENSESPGFHNGGYRALTLNYGVKVVDEKGNATYYKDAHNPTTITGTKYTPKYGVVFDKIVNGTYTVTPAFVTADGKWHDIVTMVYKTPYLKMTVADTKLTFEQAVYDPKVELLDFAIETPLYVNNYFKFSTKLTAENEYIGDISVYMYEPDGQQSVYETYPIGVMLNAGDTLEIKQTTRFRLYRPSYGIPEPGNYQVQLMRGGRPLSERIDVTYSDAPSTSIEITDLRLATGDHSPADDIHIIGSVKCNSGFYSGQLAMFLFKENVNTSKSSIYTPTLVINEDETVDFDIHGRYLEAKPGEKYFLQVRYGNSWIGNRVYFTIDEPISNVKVYGDANGDNLITSADAALTAAKVLGLNPINFDESLADINKDGKITFDDFDLILSNAVYSEFSYSSGDNVPEDVGEDFAMDDLYVAPGCRSSFNISLAALTDKRGLQFDLVLPNGLDVTNVEYVSTAGTAVACPFMNRPDGVTRVLAVTYQDVNFAADDYIKVSVKAAKDFECVGTITLYDALVDVWGDSDIVESRAANAKCAIVFDENQGVSDIAADGLNVTVAGRVIIINADADATVVMTDILGRANILNIKQGETRIEVPAAGTYFVGKHKVVVCL